MSRKRLGLVAGVGLTAFLCSSRPAQAQSLGAASSFAIEGAAGVTAAGAATINGNVGSSPNASITGFPPALVVPPFGIHANDAAAIAAQGAATALFISLGNGACTDFPTAQMSGASFGPGIHCFTSTADLASTGSMTLSGAGLYIFRVGSALTANTTSTVLAPGVDPCNVFWQVTSMATLNGANFVGNIVAQAGVTLGVGANLAGRALATAGPVTLTGTNTVGGCSPAVPPVCPLITLVPNTLGNGTVGVAYSQPISATGGAAPSTFVVTSGTLPAGLTLSPTGVLAGTPTTAGTSSFIIRTSDALGCFQDGSYSITVAAAVPTLSQWAMIALTLLLALAGFTAMRRRNSRARGVSPFHA